MIRHRVFLATVLLLTLTLASLLLQGRSAGALDACEKAPLRRELVSSLHLTDFSLWTEARYTRHPALADRFAPFQDAPAALEHFPAGSILACPPRTEKTALKASFPRGD